MATTKKITPALERKFQSFMDERGAQPFRRQDLASYLYPHIQPRRMEAASGLADAFMNRLHAAGQLKKAGHVHWQLVISEERTLLSGRKVRENADVRDLTLKTRCPEKYVTIDLETGDVWVGSSDGFKRAAGEVLTEALSILTKSASVKKVA